MKILTEASGSLTSGYLLRAIKEAGHISVASDIHDFHHGAILADDFVKFPASDDPGLWAWVETMLKAKGIDIVIPSLDETLLGWSDRVSFFKERGTHVIVSPSETIRIFRDKWLTALFFKEHGVPAPATSLAQDFPLVKPRDGRGGVGVRIASEKIDMTGMVAQEIAKGVELTVDCLFDRDGLPLYIVPRRRIGVRGGKSTKGEVVKAPIVESWIRNIAKRALFIGPVNFQCFIDGDDVSFVEINPRIAGGMALGFAATENWIPLLLSMIIERKSFEPKPTKYGMRMVRYYEEVFI